MQLEKQNWGRLSYERSSRKLFELATILSNKTHVISCCIIHHEQINPSSNFKLANWEGSTKKEKER